MADTQDTAYVATRSFTTTINGEEFTVNAGSTMIRSGHPLLKYYAAEFREVSATRGVEQATAAPGEKRG